MHRSAYDSLEAQAEIRKSMRQLRASLDPDYRDIASSEIADTIFRSNWFSRAKKIACYLPVGAEVDTWPVILRAWQMRKRVFAPVVQENYAMRFFELTTETVLVRGSFGIYEPITGLEEDPARLDIVITPLVAFDKKMNRIGMGGGYFDRTFAFLKHRKSFVHPKLIGVAYACQEVEKIDANTWDIPLFHVVTN